MPEHLIPGGHLVEREAGEFKDEDSGRVVKFDNAIMASYRGKKYPIPCALALALAEALADDPLMFAWCQEHKG